MIKEKTKSFKAKNASLNAAVYAVLVTLSVIWLIPILWIVVSSLKIESGIIEPYFFPKQWGLDNYINLWSDMSTFQFPLWFANTMLVSVLSCILTTLLTLSTAYVMSKMRFKLRKKYMNTALILGMFPGFMSMIAVYYILKAIGLTQSLFALILVYSSGAGLTFYIAKGFFDTISITLNESAKLDGANQWQIFYKIILPLSKPIIVYTALMAFSSPWMDFIFAKVIMGDAREKYTVAVGLYNMMYAKDATSSVFTLFAAGCVCVAIPIVILFMALQKYYVEGVTAGAVKG